MFKEGQLVIRTLEGMTFAAKILSVNSKRQEVVLKYLDDGNVEEDVPYDEIELSKDGYLTTAGSEEKRRHSEDMDLLARPLAGLVEDDHEIRKTHKPTIHIHSNDDDGEPIILNGAENRLAAGGGLRALRYLKK